MSHYYVNFVSEETLFDVVVSILGIYFMIFKFVRFKLVLWVTSLFFLHVLHEVKPC